MPTPIKSADRIAGHRSNAELAIRQQAQAAVVREKVTLRPPDRVKNDLVAYKYWKKTLKRMDGVDLLDDLDTDMLAAYCVQSSMRDKLYDMYATVPAEETLMRMQAQERLILQYATRLGLTAESRARLAKKKAEPPKINKFDRFRGSG